MRPTERHPRASGDRLGRAREGRIDAFFEANQAFHQKVQEIAGNRWMLTVIQDLRKVIPPAFPVARRTAWSSPWPSTGP